MKTMINFSLKSFYIKISPTYIFTNYLLTFIRKDQIMGAQLGAFVFSKDKKLDNKSVYRL